METKRVLWNPLFLAVLAALVALNCFFFVYQQPDGQGDFREYGNMYHQEFDVLSDLSCEEGLAWCEAAEQEVVENWENGESSPQNYEIIQQLTTQY